MPRIRQMAVQYAEEDFRGEIRKQQGIHDVMTIRALARHLEMPHTTLGYKLKEPQMLTVGDLRKIVSRLGPDPKKILLLMGYTSKDIKDIGGFENGR